eukprot:gene12528-biopygen4947
MRGQVEESMHALGEEGATGIGGRSRSPGNCWAWELAPPRGPYPTTPPAPPLPALLLRPRRGFPALCLWGGAESELYGELKARLRSAK